MKILIDPLQMCKYGYIDPAVAECGKYSLKNIKVQEEWHHVCGVFQANRMGGNTVQALVSMYYDGKEVFKSK